MSRELTAIKAPIASELEAFEKHFRESVRSRVALLDKIMHYIVNRKGKQMRPIFVLLSARICGEITPKTYTAASLVELLHTATLVHDDVVDDAHQRRGMFSINALWKNKIAVLVGDYLLSRGLLVALDMRAYDILQIVSRAVRDMSEGELLQIEKARRLDITEEVYFDIISKKTASLIAASCAAGAASVTDDQDTIDKFYKFGEAIGIAFQIKDDLFDYGDLDIGKPRAIDIKEKKMTLPLIYTLQNVDSATRKKLIQTVEKFNTDKKRVKELIQQVHASGGIKYAEEVMERYIQAANMMIQEFVPGPATSSMKGLIGYVIQRGN
ncbi:MAG: polyprenyl synthetase family protein [Saprospiraceae bacterium]|uniref:Polyprenyl synthetase family protein n=1 Tax=Candidatus Opimibacter skivensis TaxID=2982028 RepID=A0A9D7XRD3_9BACT|nr:polyprenyl synthetase family protein [Candidatus Opimibacter skivensis]